MNYKEEEPGFEGQDARIVYGLITRPNGEEITDVTLSANEFLLALDTDGEAISITAKSAEGQETFLVIKANVFWTMVSLLSGVNADDLSESPDVPKMPIVREDLTITEEQIQEARETQEFNNLIRSLNLN